MTPSFIFLFPGQGSQYVRMGLELCQTYPQAKAIFERADELLGRKISSLIFEGPEEELTRTDNLQPAVTIVNVACLTLLQEYDCRPVAVAGHSLGEYTAHYAAGVFDFSALLRLVQARGSLMQEAAEAHPGSMLVVIGLDQESLFQITEEASAYGTICIANYNTPEQMVLSGAFSALERASDAAKSAGAKRTLMLQVSGAWHSPLMGSITEKFEAELAQVTFRDAHTQVYCNVTAKPERDASKIRQLLGQQICSPVRWSETMLQMTERYPDAVFTEVGPGRVLKGIMLVMDRRRKVYNIENPGSLETWANTLKKTQPSDLIY